jgi:hypothetical protein
MSASTFNFSNGSSTTSTDSTITPASYGDNKSTLTSVVLGTSATIIGNNAFQSCSSLASITIPNSVTSIGNYAFFSCSSLASITIPNSITSIGYGTFYDCSNLASITIPNNVTSIANSTFYNCSSLASITIPNNVTSIGYYAFEKCSSLVSFIFEDQSKLTSIGNDIFFNTPVMNVKYFLTTDYDSLSATSKSLQTQFTQDSTYEYYPYASCFNEGTKILCLNKNFEEEYIPIENLKNGDLVKSYKHGYRKIDIIGKNLMINNPNRFSECMYKMVKTTENGLIEDLIITGGHSILVNNLGDYKEENSKLLGEIQVIDDKYLLLACVSKDFVKVEDNNMYTYYHFALENNNGNNDERFGVWANGILTESTCKNNFINHKYIL